MIAFVFARGGSKGLPGKNIKLLKGIPLLAYSIRIAKNLNLIDSVYVSTDCSDIEKVAVENGAKVIKRPRELASDTASEWDAWQHAVTYLMGQGCMTQDDLFLSLPATAPLRKEEDVRACIDEFRRAEVDIVITIRDAERSPYFNMMKYNDDGNLDLVITPDKVLSRRQETPKVFDVTTVAYVTTPSYIFNCHSVLEGIVGGVKVPNERSIDIDTLYDFKIAEALVEDVDPLGCLSGG
ncbi:MAG: acylneuraminate cytidylyltransferase family protein [Pseudomonadales bacterium]|nr:acylneuraminate cytidylyltransferase family protein [Pseudomonadales bacterium]